MLCVCARATKVVGHTSRQCLLLRVHSTSPSKFMLTARAQCSVCLLSFIPVSRIQLGIDGHEGWVGRHLPHNGKR